MKRHGECNGREEAGKRSRGKIALPATGAEMFIATPGPAVTAHKQGYLKPWSSTGGARCSVDGDESSWNRQESAVRIGNQLKQKLWE